MTPHDNDDSDGGTITQKPSRVSFTDVESIGEERLPLQHHLLTRFLWNKDVPVVPLESERTEIPLKKAGTLSQVFMTWMLPVLSVGYRRTITQPDLWKLTDDLKITTNSAAFQKNLHDIIAEFHAKNPDKLDEWPNRPIHRAIWRTFGNELSFAIFLNALSAILTTLTPLLTKYLINTVQAHVDGVPNSVAKGVGYSVGITVMIGLSTFFSNHSLLLANIVGARSISVLTKAILEMSLHSTAETRHKFPPGKIMGFVGSDLQRINQTCIASIRFAGLPFSLIIGITVLCVNLKAAAPVGIVTFLILTGLSIIPTRFYSRFRAHANVWTDKRSAVIRQILQSMQMVKFYSWEDAYEKIVVTMRDEEIHWVYRLQVIIALVFSNSAGSPGISSMAAILVSYAISGLTGAGNIFPSLSLFQILTSTASECAFALPSLIDGLKSAERIASYLKEPIVEQDKESFYGDSSELAKGIALEMKNTTFFWDVFTEVETEPVTEVNDEKPTKEKSKRNSHHPQAQAPKKVVVTQNTVLHDVCISIEEGDFVIITGLTGCGKSSLLSAMSGMMGKSQGSVCKNGDLLLCGTPSVLNATIKDNILYGKQYDSSRYKEVLRVCDLESDLHMFQAGDMTEVGERGVTLSGGQKARVNLARAIYQEKDIYLFDDVISAVDANVGKHIIDNCMLDYLAGKTRVLATHNLAVIQKADKVIFINENGTVECGTESELLAVNKEFQALMTHKNEVKERPVDWSMENIDVENPEHLENTDEKQQKKNMGGMLVQAEERAVNGIPVSLYWKYLSAGTVLGSFILPLVIFLAACAVFVNIFSSVWLTYWLEDKFLQLSSGGYVGIYVFLSLLSWISVALVMSLLGYTLAHAAKVLHLRALHRVLHTPMSFMDSTPIGRIMNRFTRDTNSLDNQLPNNIKLTIYTGVNSIGILVLAIIYVPWFAISIPFFLIAFVGLCDYSQATSRELRRMDAINRSFVLNNLNEVLNGADSIKAYGVQEMFVTKNDQMIDIVNEVSLVSIANIRWINLSLNLLATGCVLIVTILSATGVFGMTAASTGLLTNYIIQFTKTIAQVLNYYTTMENEMNSVERTYHYAHNLVQEAAYRKNETKPAPEWPQSGTIKFDKVSLRYREGLPLVLKDLSMNVGEHEKVGICGRTGAGKSSLMNVLFRINEVETGSVVIDGIDISKLGLYELRSKLSIIPQDPVLFEGTIRSNLDPFGEKADDELWEALSRGGLIKDVDAVKSGSTKDHKFHLDAVVEDEGSNFSLGERQLIALTRALVRRSKILVMDEATSSVDYETDAFIQETIAREFKDCTILCIAHRLKTILKYDRVLVLEKGEFDEFDKPHKLFLKGGRFREMCASAGITEADFH